MAVIAVMTVLLFGGTAGVREVHVADAGAAGSHLVSLKITPTKPSAARGSTVQFTATGKFANGTVRDITSSVKWRSSSKKTATISTQGLAKVVAAKGTVTITATYKGKHAATALSVRAARTLAVPATATTGSSFKSAPLQLIADKDASGASAREIASTGSRTASQEPAVVIIPIRSAASVITTVGPKLLHQSPEQCRLCHLSAALPDPHNKEEALRLVEAVPKLCYRCHTVSGTTKSLHMPVKEGMCTTCHDPHASAGPKLLVQPVKDLCVSCHPEKTDHRYVHGPTALGDCLACHDPHGSANAHLLVKDGTELCLICHADMQGEIRKKMVHPALASGCTSCHDPHGSAEKKFLSADGARVCFACHPDIANKVSATAKSIHAPIKSERGCASCHSPHASDEPKLLPKARKDLCLDCHKDLIKKTQTVLHGPVAGGCTRCHDPHGTPNEKLLIKPYSTEFYVSYSDNEFPLCFSCHNRDLLRFPTTSSATGFRDGDKNLHYLHVNRKDRGKQCKACHVIHAGENPKLIADRVPFGDWNLPLKFVKTENGGSCSPGCHQPYAYDRKNPAKGAPPAATTKEKTKKQ